MKGDFFSVGAWSDEFRDHRRLPVCNGRRDARRATGAQRLESHLDRSQWQRRDHQVEILREPALSVREEDALVSQLLLCDKFGLNVAEERARPGWIHLTCDKREKGQVRAVLGCGEIRSARRAEQSVRQAEYHRVNRGQTDMTADVAIRLLMSRDRMTNLA